MPIFDQIKPFLRRVSDLVLEGRNRTRILLGTDRKDVRPSGWGDEGEGDKESGTIDIVSGYVDENPDYVADASRVYISGKTNPDEYFEVQVGESIEGEPAIIQHSSNVYILARSRIKIVIDAQTSIVIDGNNIALNKGSSFITLTDNDISIGSQNPTDAPSLARLVDAELRKIQTTLSSLVAPTSGGPVTSASPYIPSSVASQRIKMD